MLKAIVFENFVHFKDKQVINFGKSEEISGNKKGIQEEKAGDKKKTKRRLEDTEAAAEENSENEQPANQLHFFVGANFCGKSTVLELIRRCMTNDINVSVTNSFSEENVAYVFCKFDLNSEEVISGLIKEGNNCDPRRFHKVLIYNDECKKMFRCESFECCNSKPIKGFLRNVLENEDALGDLFRRGKKSSCVTHILEKIKSRNNEIEEKENEIDWKNLENAYIATMPLRGIGIVQWTKSGKIVDKVKNYKMACERAEIISKLLSEKNLIDMTKEERYFKYLAYPEEFKFDIKEAEVKGAEEKGAEEKGAGEKIAEEKIAGVKGAEEKGAREKIAEEKGAGGKGSEEKGARKKGAKEIGAGEKEAEEKGAEIYVTHGSFDPFPLLKTSEGILEAKQASLLLAHKNIKTLILEEPCRGMHAQMVERLRAILYQEGLEKTIIVSTHNPYFIDTITINNTNVFFRTQSKDSKYSCNIRNVGLQKDLSKVSDVETLRSLLFATKVLLVEGPIDRDVVQTLFTHRRECRGMEICNEEKADITTYQIIPIGGCQNAKDVLNFCKYINLPALCLLDRDKYVTIKNLQTIPITKKPEVEFCCKLVVLNFLGVDRHKIKTYTERFQYREASCFIENEIGFKELSDYLIKDKKTFIWKWGALEDAILSSENMNREIATSLEIDLSDPEPSKRCKILKNKLKERLNEKERKEFSKHLSEVDEIKRFLGFMEDEENKRMQNQDNLKTEDSTEISIAELNENFVKFSSLLVAEGTFTLIKRIKHEIAKDDTCPTIDVFIEKNKHTLFHLFESKNCCQCETSENNYHKVMSCEQWSCLFKKNTKKCNNSMPADQCCCQFSADSNLDISTLDITLLSLILLHICTLGIDEREEVKKIQMQATRYFDPSSIPYMTNNAYVENFNDTSFALETIGKAIGDEMFLEIKEKIETLEETKVADLCRHLIGLLQLQRKTKGEDMERIETELRQIHKKNRRDSDTSVEDIWSYVPQTKSGNMLFLLCFFIKAFCLLRKTRLLFYK